MAGPRVGDAYIKITADGKAVSRALDKLEATTRRRLDAQGNAAGKKWADEFEQGLTSRVDRAFRKLSDSTIDIDFSNMIRDGETLEEGVARITREVEGWEKGLVDVNGETVDLRRGQQSILRITKEQREEIEKSLNIWAERQRSAEETAAAEERIRQLVEAQEALERGMAAERERQRRDDEDFARWEQESKEKTAKLDKEIFKEQERLSKIAADRRRREVADQERLAQQVSKSFKSIDKSLEGLNNRTLAWSTAHRRHITGLMQDWEDLRMAVNNGDIDLDKQQQALEDFAVKFDEVNARTGRAARIMGKNMDSKFIGRFRIAMRDAGREGNFFARSMGRLSAAFKAIKIPSFREMTSRMDSTVRAVLILIAVAAENVASLGSGVAAAGTALVSSLAYALGIVIPLAAGASAALIGVALAVKSWDGMKETVDGFAESLDSVASAWAGQAEKFGQAWGPSLTEFMNAISELLSVSDIGASLGTAFAGITDSFTKVVNGPGMANFLAALEGPLSSGLALFGDGLAGVTDGILNLLAAAGPGFETLGGMFSEWGQNFSDTMAEMAADGTIADFVDRAIGAWEDLMGVIGPLGRALGNVFSAGEESGSNLLESLGDLMTRFAEWTESIGGQHALETWFNRGEKVMSALGDLIGGVAEALGGLVDATTIDNVSDLLTGLGEFAPVLGDILRVISNLDLLGSLVDLLNVVGEALAPIIPLFQDFASLLGDTIGDVIVIITPLLMAIGEALLPIAEALLPIIEELLPVFLELIELLIPILVPLVELLGVALADALTTLAPFITTIVEIIGEHLMPILEGLAEVVGTAVETITAMIEGDWTKAWALFEDLVYQAATWVVDTVINLGTAINEAVEAFMKLVNDQFARVWEAIKTGAKTFWDWLKKIVSDSLAKAHEAVLTQLGKITTGFSNAWSAVKTGISDFLTNAKTSISTGIEDLAGYVKELPTKIKNFLSDMLAIGVGVAEDFIQGMVNGLTGGVNRVVQSARDVASSAWNAVTDFLGIGSPSKLMATVGHWFDAGLARGVERSMSLPASAAEAMAQSVVDSVDMDAMVSAGIDAAEKFANGLTSVGMPSLDADGSVSGSGPSPWSDGGMPDAMSLGSSRTVVFAEGSIVVQTPASNPTIVAEQVMDIIAERMADANY